MDRMKKAEPRRQRKRRRVIIESSDSEIESNIDSSIDRPSSSIENVVNHSGSSATSHTSFAKTDVPAWLQEELNNLRIQAELDYIQREDMAAATMMALPDQEFRKLAEESEQVKRHPNALKISKNGLISKFDELVKKAFIDCNMREFVSKNHGGDCDEAEAEEIDDELSENGESEDDNETNVEIPSARDPHHQEFDPEETGSSLVGGERRIVFQGRVMELAQNASEFEAFVASTRALLYSYDGDMERRRFVEQYNESTIYRAIVTMHKWLVFCAYKAKDPNQLTPELLRDFRDWLVTLKTNIKRLYIDRNQFNLSMQKGTIGAQLVRVFIVYKMMGVIPTTKRLLHFLGGKEEAGIFFKWMDMQPGVVRPFRRFPILPSDVDYFIEQLQFTSDKDFEMALYLLTMVNVGARTASLIHVNTTTRGGLLAKDVKFILLPNQRLHCRIKITHEKQSPAVNTEREVKVEDRLVCVSLSMAMFVQFVRLEFFENSPTDILDGTKFCGIGDDRFKLRIGVEEMTVFKRCLRDDGSELSKLRLGQFTPNDLTIDIQFFAQYSRTMRLPRRGFSSRSLRQGLAIRIIMQDIKQRGGEFNKQACVNLLIATGIWDTRVAIVYIEDLLKMAFNPTNTLYGSSNIEVVDQYVSPSHFRLPVEEYVEDNDQNVIDLVNSMSEIRRKRETLDQMEGTLSDKLALANLEMPHSSILSKSMKLALSKSKVDVAEVAELNSAVKTTRQRLAILVKKRASQYADDINYRRFVKRLNSIEAKDLQALQPSGVTFDYAAMADGVYQYNTRDALWQYAPVSKPNMVISGGVLCVVDGCSFKPASGFQMAEHLAKVHQVYQGGARKKNAVERFASRREASNSTRDDPDGNDAEKNFRCKKPNCSKGRFPTMSHLAGHFRAKHWIWYYCKTCKAGYFYPEFKSSEHVDHEFTSVNNNFQYGDFRVGRCQKCDATAVTMGISNVLCISFLDKVKSALSPELVTEFYECSRLESFGEQDEENMLKTKRRLLYRILKKRLFGRVDIELPSCILKEVQRMYSEEHAMLLSQEI